MNCPFCEIFTRHDRIIRETQNTFTILSNPRLMPGHLLIIPKKHTEKLSELNAEERKELFNEVMRFEKIILEKVASGCDISQHYRPFIKQNRLKVNHLHIHIRPREFEDELYKKVQVYERAIFKDLSLEEFEKYKKIFADGY